jgi:hypothetical protein
MKIYNPDQIQFQRDQFSAASLEEHVTVADLSKRLTKLVCGLPECQSQEIKGIILKQRLNDALPRKLQTAYSNIRHTHSYDMAASVLSTVQRTKGIVGRSKRREPTSSIASFTSKSPSSIQVRGKVTAAACNDGRRWRGSHTSERFSVIYSRDCTGSAGRPPTFTSWWWRTASWRHAELSGSSAS